MVADKSASFLVITETEYHDIISEVNRCKKKVGKYYKETHFINSVAEISAFFKDIKKMKVLQKETPRPEFKVKREQRISLSRLNFRKVFNSIKENEVFILHNDTLISDLERKEIRRKYAHMQSHATYEGLALVNTNHYMALQKELLQSVKEVIDISKHLVDADKFKERLNEITVSASTVRYEIENNKSYVN